MGNIAVHRSAPISVSDSLHPIEELFHVLYWLCRSYSPNGKTLGKIDFNSQLIQQPQQQGKNELTLIQLQTLETKLSQAEEMKAIALERERQTAAELDRLKAELTALKQTNTKVPDPHNYNETNTRKYLIDVLLREMGWDLTHPDSIEYPVEGMPISVNPSGKGAVDYVLWDDNGLPLAVVEAKRTRRSPDEGKQQAKLYADCLEQKFHQRPVIFYSNGDRTFIWDDHNYPEREIQGFLKKDELQRLIWRRTNNKPLHLEIPDANIAGRSYQTEAIRRIGDNFAHKSRKAWKKVEAYIRNNQNHIAIAKLRRNLPLTETDLTALEEMLFVTEGLESREKFLDVYTDTAQNSKSFIRTLVGLDRAAAKEAFSKYIENQQFSANQIRFVEQIIDLLTQQGVMNPRLLYEPPFTDFHRDGLDGVFGDDDADSIVAIVRSFNQTVEMTFESA